MKSKVTLEILNPSRAIKPSGNDVLLYDESKKCWIISTKEEILQDAKNLLNDCQKELSFCRGEATRIKADNEEFKRNVSAQIHEMSDLIMELYKK